MPGGVLFARAGITLTLRPYDPGKPISADPFGIFFEDIYYSKPQ